MTEAERELAATHAAKAARNARAIARRLRSIDPHEIEEACDRALMIAAARHDPGRSAFATCLHWETRDQVSKVISRHRRRRVWPVAFGAGGADEPPDPTSPGPHDRAAEAETADAVAAALGRLTPFQAACVRSYYGFGRDPQDDTQTAARLGAFRQATFRARVRGLARLKTALADAARD